MKPFSSKNPQLALQRKLSYSGQALVEGPEQGRRSSAGGSTSKSGRRVLTGKREKVLAVEKLIDAVIAKNAPRPRRAKTALANSPGSDFYEIFEEIGGGDVNRSPLLKQQFVDLWQLFGVPREREFEQLRDALKAQMRKKRRPTPTVRTGGVVVTETRAPALDRSKLAFKDMDAAERRARALKRLQEGSVADLPMSQFD